MICAIIIEDEPKAVSELKDILEHLSRDITVIATLESVEESIEWLQSHASPDIIFSDIQLSDGLSFEIYKKVKIQAPIIFCTAFDDYMLNAFEANGISYLLKPISKVKLEESLKKYEELKIVFKKDQEDYIKRIDSLLGQLRPSHQSALLINVRDKIMPVKTDDVACLHYNNGVVSVILFNHQQYFIQEPLDDLEHKLNPALFYRVNRQYIINRHCIQEIERYFSRKLALKLTIKTPEPVVVSKVKAGPFLEWMKTVG